MRSDVPKSNHHSNSTSSRYFQQLIDALTPRLHCSWKRILLEDNQYGITAIEVTRTILRERERKDVKDCSSDRCP
ncbi:MAG: hypothetical protein HC865_00505 [Cyanobacteria bacterium RU_5_0]|nr:hypothetical protein [Cyanobacteria bacterium RU_5_0]